MNLSETFIALSNEAQFTRDMLGGGATQIRKANYAQKGVYFQAFTSLSTGLERIGKICLMLDHYIKNNGEFPDINYMKREIGHNIFLLYEKSLKISAEYAISFNYQNELNGDIHQNILKILSEFALGDRYSNINVLVGVRQAHDPISLWFNKVDTPLFEKHVAKQRKEKIVQNAQLIDHLTSQFVRVMHISETGSLIQQVEEGSFRTGMYEAVAPYRQLYVIQIIRFWAELSRGLQYKAMELCNQDIPFLSEIFAPFYNPDAYIKTRKTWDKI